MITPLNKRVILLYICFSIWSLYLNACPTQDVVILYYQFKVKFRELFVYSIKRNYIIENGVKALKFQYITIYNENRNEIFQLKL